jgi:hypothetical protein
MLDGTRNIEVSRYFASFLSVGSNLKVSYPLCYVREIFNKLSMTKATVMLVKILTKLDSQLDSTKSGLAWECTVQTAIIMRMLKSCWFGSDFFDWSFRKADECEIDFAILPDECNTLEGARQLMNTMIAGCTKPTLIYVGTALAVFPSVECFAIYTANGVVAEAKIMGFQMKSSDLKPRHPIDTHIINCGAVLVRGRVKAKNPRAPKEGWRYLSSAQVRDFLGNSLLLGMPRAWLLDG